MEPRHGDRPHLPAPTVYPIGFAAGVATILVGLIVNPKIIAPIGGAIAVIFAFLWFRDATAEYRGAPPEIKHLVDRRWSEYGIDLDAAAQNGGMRKSSRPLQRLLRR